jgi:hypothetical protein
MVTQSSFLTASTNFRRQLQQQNNHQASDNINYQNQEDIKRRFFFSIEVLVDGLLEILSGN